MSPQSDTSLDCPTCFMSGLPCSPHFSPHPFVSVSFPPALAHPSLLPCGPLLCSCLSLQELPPSSVYQPWGSGTPGALISATAPPPGSTRWPRRYQQQPPLPHRHLCSRTGPWVAGCTAQRGSGTMGDKGDKWTAGLRGRTMGSPPWPTEWGREQTGRKGSREE